MAIKEYLRHSFVSAVLLWLLIIQAMFPCLHTEDRERSCSDSERTALLNFKTALADPQSILSSWKGEDCCRWWGVACNNKTGHVVELNLRSTSDIFTLGGKINPSLVYLKHLRRLDLSHNNFSGSHIPEFFGSLENLRYLNLSGAGFTGMVPPHLGNLSRLLYLDLSAEFSENYLSNLDANDLKWIKHLSSLKYLDMSTVNLTAAVDWLFMLNMLPSLTGLKLNLCGLDSIPSYLPNINFTALNTLELMGNNFNDTLPMWLGNISSLNNLDLSDSGLFMLAILIFVGLLPNNCSSSKIFEGDNAGYDDEDGDEMVWLYLSMGLGYVVGFWAVCGVLWFKKTWRYAYFRFFDRMYDRLYVAAPLTLAKLKRATMKRN